MKETKKQKIEAVAAALQTITTHCPCYGKRNTDPVYIAIENGLVLRNSKGRFLTSGTNKVAEKLIKLYGDNNK